MDIRKRQQHSYSYKNGPGRGFDMFIRVVAEFFYELSVPIPTQSLSIVKNCRRGELSLELKLILVITNPEQY